MGIMAKVKVFSDSTCDLSPALIDKYDIGIVPLYVTLDEQSFRDGVEIGVADIYHYVDEHKSLPKTAAATAVDFIEAFSPYVEEDCQIFYTGIGAKLSATYQNIAIAAQEFPDGTVYYIDSQNLSTGTGLLVLAAAEMAQAGLTGAQIAEKIEGLVPRVRAGFFVDTLRYLYYGGRCSALQSMIGGALRLRPRLIVKDGAIVPGQKYRGTWRHCLDQYYQDVIGDGHQVDPQRIFVTHTPCPEDDVAYAVEKLKEQFPGAGIYDTDAGAVIGSHCGPGTLGILYIEK
jgi:DegV family protein with EDD domain